MLEPRIENLSRLNLVDVILLLQVWCWPLISQSTHHLFIVVTWSSSSPTSSSASLPNEQSGDINRVPLKSLLENTSLSLTLLLKTVDVTKKRIIDVWTMSPFKTLKISLCFWSSVSMSARVSIIFALRSIENRPYQFSICQLLGSKLGTWKKWNL